MKVTKLGERLINLYLVYSFRLISFKFYVVGEGGGRVLLRDMLLVCK